MEVPQTKYARSGHFSIAYQVLGDGPIDLVHIPGLISNLDLAWEHPGYRRFMERLARFARVIVYDKRGTGLSDPVTEPPSVEERIDDTRAVMDAVGVDRAALFGCSEGATLAAFFAASYPQRVTHAVLYGSFARIAPDPPDYPWGYDSEVFQEFRTAIDEAWGEGVVLTLLAPSQLDDPAARAFWGRFERASSTPRIAEVMFRANFTLDMRAVLPSIQAPTLVLHRSADILPIEGGRYVADHIPGARFVELAGDDHWPWVTDPDEVTDRVEEFLTGVRRDPDPRRVLATVLFTDIVGSTERAAELGDARWRGVLDAHDSITRAQLGRYNGREVKMTGDGILATFDGPARAIRCARDLVDALRSAGIDIRSGIHTGECELRNGDMGGVAVHIGARVMAMAGAGEVLVSRTVKDLTVGSDIEFEDRGTHVLKGVPGEWQVHAVADV